VAAAVFLAYTIPAYLLAGIHYPKLPDLNAFYLYLGKWKTFYLFLVHNSRLPLLGGYFSFYGLGVITFSLPGSASMEKGYIRGKSRAHATVLHTSTPKAS
jgi:hypothetical protein